MTAAPATATMVAVRTFNTVGSVRAERHYQIASLSWIDLDEVLGLIRDERYFVLHAPRQTGKTSALLALRDRLNVGAAGDFRCLYANVENGQAMRENVAEGTRTVLGELAYQASVTLGDETLEELWHALLVRVGRAQALARWRAGAWPASAGAPDRRDRRAGGPHAAVGAAATAHRAHRPTATLSAQHHSLRAARRARLPHPLVTGESRGARRQRVQHQVGIVAARRLYRAGDARPDRTAHGTDRAGVHTEDAPKLIWERTAGQPWLVNALCYDACFRHRPGRDRERPITAAAVPLEAQERLIMCRDTHTDDLAHKLGEERVRRVIEPILAGTDR